MTKRLLVFAVPFSANLGDGVIFECLAQSIRSAAPEIEVVPMDLAGRERYGEVKVRNRQAILKAMPWVPGPIRRTLIYGILQNQLKRRRHRWAETAATADAAVIGGGQLFADADLNFPTKIGAAADIIAAEKLPLAVFSVGAGTPWSHKGAALFALIAKADLRAVTARDPHSLQRLSKQLPPLPAVQTDVTADPGLLASRCFPYSGARADIGLCITAPEVLNYHSDHGAGSDPKGFLSFYRDVAATPIKAGKRVALFSNGAEEDEATIDALLDRPTWREWVAQGVLRRVPRASHPRELCQIIAGFEGIVAHRLHACIVAYSYGVPVIGLKWDRKVESFFEQAGCGSQLADHTACPSAVVTTLVSLVDGSAPPDRALVDKAAADIERLLAWLDLRG